MIEWLCKTFYTASTCIIFFLKINWGFKRLTYHKLWQFLWYFLIQLWLQHMQSWKWNWFRGHRLVLHTWLTIFTQGKHPRARDCWMIEKVPKIMALEAMMDAIIAITNIGQYKGSAKYEAIIKLVAIIQTMIV